VIARYRVLAERLRAELGALEQVVNRAEGAIDRAIQHVNVLDFVAFLEPLATVDEEPDDRDAV